MFGVGDGPSSLPGLDWFIFTPQAPFEAAITLWTLFVTFLLLLFTKPQSAYWKICYEVFRFASPVYTTYMEKGRSRVSRMSLEGNSNSFERKKKRVKRA